MRGYDLTFDGLVTRQGPNYRELIAKFMVQQDGESIDTLEPSQAHLHHARYVDHRSRTADPRLQPALSVARRPRCRMAAIAVRLYHKPLVLLIWLGAVIMVLGGALSLSDRRLRVGAPRPAQKSRAAAGGVSVMSLAPALRRFAFMMLAAAAPALAVQPDEILPDAALEERARALSRELRCMVCQNQSIDDSDAPLARDCACWCASA